MCLTQHAQDKMNCQSTLGSDRILLVDRIMVLLVVRDIYAATQGRFSGFNVETSSFSRVRCCFICIRVIIIIISTLPSRTCYSRLTCISAASSSSRPDRPRITHTYTHLTKVLSLPSYTSTSFAWLALSNRNPPR
jgi:hypothetical protein